MIIKERSPSTSFVDEFSELRKRDARSLFSCQDLGSILEPVAELLTASANLLTALTLCHYVSPPVWGCIDERTVAAVYDQSWPN